MKVIAVDDERLALNNIVKLLRQVLPDAEVLPFGTPGDAFDYLSRNAVDIAFLDIEMGGLNGIALGKRCKELCPKVNIIFVTGYSEYMMEAFRLHASGYLMKPVLLEDLKAELQNLRHPTPKQGARRVRIQTFGFFEIFVDNKPLPLPRRKCRECLAYLVDRRGARVTTRELASILWEGQEMTRTIQNHTLKIISDLVKSLQNVGLTELVLKSRGDIALNVDMVDCDYYQALDGEMSRMNTFRGEYMSNYSWAEFTLGELIRWSEQK